MEKHKKYIAKTCIDDFIIANRWDIPNFAKL